MNTPKLPPLPEPSLHDGVCVDAKGKYRGTFEGFTADQMQSYATAAIAAQGVPDHCDPSSTTYDLAAMVMSDCGHSTNNQRLLDRIAARIDKHVESLLASAPPAPQTRAPQNEPNYTAADVTAAHTEGYRLGMLQAAVVQQEPPQPPGFTAGWPWPEFAVQQEAAAAWQQGYDQGVIDERISEANIGIAGFNAKVNPARQNPYTHPSQQAKPQRPAHHFPDVKKMIEAKPLSDAARDVLAERQRQISAEGWTPEHDDKHKDDELSLAAASYAICDKAHMSPPGFWPWDRGWWKPSNNPRRNLVKAGALILAEIERLDRAEAAHGIKE